MELDVAFSLWAVSKNQEFEATALKALCEQVWLSRGTGVFTKVARKCIFYSTVLIHA